MHARNLCQLNLLRQLKTCRVHESFCVALVVKVGDASPRMW